jgi:disulfide bond formation protein DsbB
MTNDQPPKRTADPAIFPILILMGGFGLLLILLLGNVPRQARVTPTPISTEVAAAPTTASTLIGDNGIPYELALVEHGRSAFQTTCSACHGLDARGIQGLGKDLVESPFIDGVTDRQLLAFITTGRPVYDPTNTTGIEMPARGGNPTLSDDDITAIIAYLRTTPADEEPAQVAAAPTAVVEVQPFVLPSFSGGDGTASTPQPEEPFVVETAYTWACSTCHGIDGQGVTQLGPAFSESELVTRENSEELFNFLAQGWSFADVHSRFPHPPRGGYPVLNDEELEQLVDYLYTLDTAQ